MAVVHPISEMASDLKVLVMTSQIRQPLIATLVVLAVIAHLTEYSS